MQPHAAASRLTVFHRVRERTQPEAQPLSLIVDVTQDVLEAAVTDDIL